MNRPLTDDITRMVVEVESVDPAEHNGAQYCGKCVLDDRLVYFYHYAELEGFTRMADHEQVYCIFREVEQ